MAWRWLGGAAVLAAAGASVLAWRPVSDWQAERRAADAVAAVSQCLIGQAPGDGADANKRLRRVSIAASIDMASGQSWPTRCAPHVDRLRGALSDVSARRKQGCAESVCDEEALWRIAGLREEAGRAAELSERGHSALFDADRMLVLAREMGWADGAAPSHVPAAPEPTKLADADDMTPLYVGDYLRLLTDPAGDETLELLFYEQTTRYALCNLPIVGDGGARCRTLADDIPVDLAGELLAGEAGAPPRMFAQGFEGNQWTQAVFDVRSGRRVATLAERPAGGFVWRDGTLARLGFEPPMQTLSLFRQGEGDGEAIAIDPGGKPSFGPRFVWDEIFWALPSGGGKHRMFTRLVTKGDEPLGEVRDLGETAAIGDEPEFDVCRSDRALVVMLGQRERESAMVTLAIRTDRGWQPPVSVKVGAGTFGLTCSGAGATLSWVRAVHEEAAPDDWSPTLDNVDSDDESRSDGDRAPVRGRYAVHRLRCAEGACRHARSVVSLHRYALSSRYVAGDLGDAAVVMWRSALGDIRMRLAPLEALPEAPDIPLFDDIEHGGFGWDLERDPIIGRANAVLVLISQQVGASEASATYGLRIRADGGVTPVEVVGGDSQVQPAAAL